jgi:hypothetical protein
MCYNVGNIEIYNRAMFQSPESATEWLLKLIVWEFFCTFTWGSRARSCARKRRTHVTRWLQYWARTVRPGVADPLGQLAFVIRWERGEIGGLPHCHVLISRFPERSHKLAVAQHFGVYNFVRKHHTLGTTPAVAAGLEEKPWGLEPVVEMTSDYMLQKIKD